MNPTTQSYSKIKIIMVVVLVIAVLGVFTSYRLWSKIRTIESSGSSSDLEVKKIVGEISKYVDLPVDETPTLATVSDPDKLKTQPFFSNALVGDKVLIYIKSKKAILWRPSTSKIIEISALNPSSLTDVN